MMWPAILSRWYNKGEGKAAGIGERRGRRDMGLFGIAAVLIVLTALFGYVNYRITGLPFIHCLLFGALISPAGPQRDVLLAMTYMVVVFSIIAQGLSLRRLVRRIYP